MCALFYFLLYMKPNNILAIGAILVALSVIIGAFGAHYLKPILLIYNRIETFETSVKYQFYHSFGILVCGILAKQYPDKNLNYIVLLFITGILIFSGSLYILCITNINWLGAITPIGGILFILGWLLLAYKLSKNKG